MCVRARVRVHMRVRVHVRVHDLGGFPVPELQVSLSLPEELSACLLVMKRNTCRLVA